jgi:hypothetical protein
VNQFRISSAQDVPAETLSAFFDRNFAPSKSKFLMNHGAWLYRGEDNRWLIEEGGEVAAYCAVIPTAMRVGEEHVEATWWVDLVVDENHRGEGLQSAFDGKVRATAPLIVGFPNALAAKIHRGHGWGVREDLEVRMLPLRPLEIAKRRAATGNNRTGLRLAALAAEPIAKLARRRLEKFEPRVSRILGVLDVEVLVDVFSRTPADQSTTTFRDAEYLGWRYLDAPYRSEIFAAVGGSASVPTVAAVTRVMHSEQGDVARVLDVFGALHETETVRDVLQSVAQHALSRGAIQVTVMSGLPLLSACLRAAGFVLRSPTRFCWTCSDSGLHSRIERSRLHLVLGDSDNDEP